MLHLLLYAPFFVEEQWHYLRKDRRTLCSKFWRHVASKNLRIYFSIIWHNSVFQILNQSLPKQKYFNSLIRQLCTRCNFSLWLTYLIKQYFTSIVATSAKPKILFTICPNITVDISRQVVALYRRCRNLFYRDKSQFSDMTLLEK